MYNGFDDAEFVNDKSRLKDSIDAMVQLAQSAEDMPISERIIAGDKYVKKGGNGDVKKYYQKMIEEHTI
jgi:hypothetical protein